MIIIIIHVFFLLKETDIRVETDDACAVRCCDDPAPPEPVTRLSWPGQRVSVVQLGASVTCISFQHTESVNSQLSLSPGKHFLKVNIEVPNRVRRFGLNIKEKRGHSLLCPAWARHSKSSAWQLFTVIAAQTLLDLCRVTATTDHIKKFTKYKD